MSNRLALEASPYLRQHAENPVDWFPWGEEALAKARAENKPILLSVGYSACHWCHVMAHESFENADTAAIMNRHFVNIKVDREERPDLDQIYQNVAQVLTRSGGWPLTVFLTPDLKPFYGGTYFPPEDRYGRPGFPKVMEVLAHMYNDKPEHIAENTQQLSSAIQRLEDLSHDGLNERPSAETLAAMASKLLTAVDWREGGFGGAPKFPNTMGLSFLWRQGLAAHHPKACEAVTFSLTKMAAGGIYDHLGGGFARYSTDDEWLVPHFEKMLYDNALFLKLYAEVLLTAPAGTLSAETQRLYTETLRETVQYVLTRMTTPEGAFFSAEDADSEGEEGKYYVWSPDELTALLTKEEADALASAYDVTPAGNFEHSGKSILHKLNPAVEDSATIRAAKKKLLAAREKRIPPGLDDKTLTSWNALMISGLLWAAEALQDEAPRRAALRAYSFLKKNCLRDGHRLWATYSPKAKPRARHNAYLDDYAHMAAAALDVARFAPESAEAASAVSDAAAFTRVVLAQFKDEDGGAGYYFTSRDHESLIQRPKSLFDQAIPAGISVTLENLAALAALLPENPEFVEELDHTLPRLFPLIKNHPFGHGEAACAALLATLGAVTVDAAVASESPRHAHLYVKPGTGTARTYCHAQACHPYSREGVSRAFSWPSHD